jgi:hypothetical protein
MATRGAVQTNRAGNVGAKLGMTNGHNAKAEGAAQINLVLACAV